MKYWKYASCIPGLFFLSLCTTAGSSIGLMQDTEPRWEDIRPHLTRFLFSFFSFVFFSVKKKMEE